MIMEHKSFVNNQLREETAERDALIVRSCHARVALRTIRWYRV